MFEELLREKARRRAIERIRIADEARAELDLAVAESEAGRLREAAVPVRSSILVARTVDPEIVVVLQPFGMRENHAPDLECSETELVARKDFTSSTDAATPMTKTELSGNDQDVVTLLSFAQRFEFLCRPFVLANLLSKFAFTPVVELALALIPDEIEHLLHCFVVGLDDRLPPRNGEPSFGVRRKRLLGDLLIGETYAWEELTQNVGLLRDSFRLVARQVSVARLDFLVDELVAQRVLLDGSDDVGLKFVAVLDELLGAVLVEDALDDRTIHGIFRKSLDLFLLSICDAGDQCFHCHPPLRFCEIRPRCCGFPLCEASVLDAKILCPIRSPHKFAPFSMCNFTPLSIANIGSLVKCLAVAKIGAKIKTSIGSCTAVYGLPSPNSLLTRKTTRVLEIMVSESVLSQGDTAYFCLVRIPF